MSKDIKTLYFCTIIQGISIILIGLANILK